MKTAARPVAVALLLVAACDDYLLPSKPVDTDTTGPGAEGWCGVDALFRRECVVCHSSGGALGGLDLQTDAYAAVVGVSAQTGGGRVLVQAGDPDGSFLLRKITGTLQAGDGGSMPPGVPLSEAEIGRVRTWIQDGATDVCDAPVPDTGGGARHHPDGFLAPSEHGRAAKFQEERCITCHGDTLEGVGNAVSCDTCHEAGWRTDCTFCHGQPAEGSGSPPVHLSGVDDRRQASFIPHRVHTGATALKVALDCTTCHAKPTNILTPGHVFVADSTPGVAEVDLSRGLSPAGRWNASSGTCSNLYCHGNGRGNNGSVAHTADITGCASCHPGPASRDGWRNMSGEHERHLDEGLACWECHGDTVSNANVITDVRRHVDGDADIALRNTMTRSNGTCSGTCHGEAHANRRW